MTGTPAAVASNSFIYTTGGTDDGITFTSTVQYAPINANGSLGAWATTTPLLSILSDHAAVVSNGFIYVTGGYLGGASYTSTVQYAPISGNGSLGSWTTTTPLIAVLSSHAAIVSNGFIYVMGGKNGGTSFTSTVQYAPINATGSLGVWATTTPFSTNLISHAAVASNGFIYVMGGEANSIRTSTVQYAPINANGSLGSWTTIAPIGGKMNRHSAVVSDGFIYVTGGNLSPIAYTSTVQYAPINANGSLGAWATTISLLSGLSHHSAIVSNGFIYTTGGTHDGTTFTSTVQYAQLPSKNLYFGLGVPGGTAGGNYSSTITYTSVYSP